MRVYLEVKAQKRFRILALSWLIILLITIAPVSAQNLFNQPRRTRFEHFTSDNLLDENTIATMMQDHLGFIWFVSETNLIRYDGYELKFHPFYHNETGERSSVRPFDMHEDRSGNIWIGGSTINLFNFDRKTGAMNSYEPLTQNSGSVFPWGIVSSFLDSHDVLWLWATNTWDLNNGTICRFNTVTHEFQEHIRMVPDDSLSAYHSFAIRIFSYMLEWCVTEDRKSNVWIGTTDKGLHCYQRDRDTFINYQFDKDNPFSLSHNTVTFLKQTENGELWVCTEGGGLNRYVPEKDGFEHFRHDPSGPRSIASDSCMYLYEDRYHNLWLSVPNGLDFIDRNTLECIHYRHDMDNPNSLSKASQFIPVHVTHDGYLWILAEDISGKKYINILHMQTGIIERCLENVLDDNAFWAIHFCAFLSDHSGMIWIGTWNRGLNKCDPYSQYFYNLNSENSGLSHNNTRCIIENQRDSGKIYVGTKNGLNLFNREQGRFSLVPFRQNDGTPATDDVSTMMVDHTGSLWVGTFFGGAVRLNTNGGSTRLRHNPSDPSTLSSDQILTIAQYDTNCLWIGCEMQGLNLYDMKNRKNWRFPFDPQDTATISSDAYVWSTAQDQAGDIWVGTNGGLCRFNKQDLSFKTISHAVNVGELYCCSNGYLWLGTSVNGLGKLDPGTCDMKYYRKEQGLVNNKVNVIIEDQDGVLWLGTDGGLSKFDPETERFVNYTMKKGLPANHLQWSASQLSDGYLYFNTINTGLVFFNPKELVDNPHPPKVVLTDFKLFNESVIPGPDSPVKQDISITNRIELAHWQNDLAFVSAALHYSRPEENIYRYMLENYDRDWMDAGTRREFYYTNMNPGKYVLHVQAASSDGVWNREGVSLEILIHKPWYGTWLAYCGYFLIAAGATVLIWRNQLRRIRLQHAYQLKQAEAAKLQEVDHMKTQFLANISHEFRTPLTLILGPLDQWIKRVKDKALKLDLNIIKKNGERLLKLVNQLLDLAKIESGKLTLQLVRLDIVPFVNRIVQTFESRAKLKNISLGMKSEKSSIEIAADREKLEHILYNLLSNALKFTPGGGTVSVRIRCVQSPEMGTGDIHDKERIPKGAVEIAVRDTGPGIAPEHLDRIFDRFYQAEDSTKQTDAGTGIGLALARELAELHGGKITVESTPGKGSVFTVILPVREAEDLIESPVSESMAGEDIHEKRESGPDAPPSMDKEKSRILIVEDNGDLRQYMAGILKEAYRLTEAEHGRDGLEKAVQHMPDLVISDVMMPEMDGFELCERLKTDARTSHIPVILLTARADFGSRIQGLETGADDYLVKPFNEKELKVRVKNLIEQRRKLFRRYKNNILLPLSEVAITSADERFLTRASEIIFKNMENEEFGPDMLGKEIGLSRSQLHRKLKAIVHMTTTEFIGSVRLRQAALLLEKRAGTIAEIAYQVGFSNPAYFSECFKKQFGCVPSKYVR